MIVSSKNFRDFLVEHKVTITFCLTEIVLKFDSIISQGTCEFILAGCKDFYKEAPDTITQTTSYTSNSTFVSICPSTDDGMYMLRYNFGLCSAQVIVTDMKQNKGLFCVFIFHDNGPFWGETLQVMKLMCCDIKSLTPEEVAEIECDDVPHGFTHVVKVTTHRCGEVIDDFICTVSDTSAIDRALISHSKSTAYGDDVFGKNWILFLRDHSTLVHHIRYINPSATLTFDEKFKNIRAKLCELGISCDALDKYLEIHTTIHKKFDEHVQLISSQKKFL